MHCPLTAQTHHLIDAERIAQMRRGVMLINTSRGALVDTQVLRDDVFSRLIAFPNVLVTGHQAFFTEEALHTIAATTIANLTAFGHGEGALHHVTADGLT